MRAQNLKGSMREKVRWESVIKTDPETNEQYWSREQVTVYKAEEYDQVNAVLDILKGVTTAEEVRKKHYLWRNKPKKIWPIKARMTRSGNLKRNLILPK